MDFGRLKNKLLDSGIQQVGFANVEKALPESLKKYKYAVSVVIRLSDAVINEITDKPTYTYFHHYRTVNTFIDQQLLWISNMIIKEGYMAYPVPASQSIPGTGYSGIFQHKTAAVLSGLGWIGKNDLFITPEFGPRVRLGTVLTDMVIPCSDTVMKSRCGECSMCVDNCPAMAIKGNEWKTGTVRDELVDARACSEYMSDHFKGIGRGSVCGVCIKVCPFGKRKY